MAAIEARGPVVRAVSSEELGPVGAPRLLAAAEVEERDAIGEVGVPRVSSEKGARRRLQIGHDRRAGRPARRAEDPLGVGRDRQASPPAGLVLDGQDADLEVVVEWDVLEELERDPPVLVLEPAVAGTMPSHVRGVVEPDRRGRRTPELTRLVVADVDRLAHRVRDRIVGPRGELVLTAVAGPRVPGAGLRHQEAERGVGDDVQPRRRRRLARAEDRDVLAPAVGEPAQSIEELQLGPEGGRSGSDRRHGCRVGPRRQRRHRTLGSLEPDDLVGQAAATAQQDGPRGGLEQRAVRGRELVATQDVDPATALARLLERAGLARPDDRLEEVLEAVRIRRPVLVDDHEIHVQQLQPPVLVRPEQLPDDVDVIGLVDPDEHDREVAGDAVRPQPGDAAVVLGEQARAAAGATGPNR